MGKHPCAKCGSEDHSTAKCKSDIELREECICSEVEGLEKCGNHITTDDWNKGYRIHRNCKNFLAGAASLMALIGTCIPGRQRATIKKPRKARSGTNEALLARRAQNEKEGLPRRTGNSGPRTNIQDSSEAALKENMTAADYEAIMAASLTPEKDEQGRWRIPRARVIVKRIDLASPIAPRLRFRPPNKTGRSKREQSGDPTLSGEPTPSTVCAIDSLLYLCASAKHGLPIQIWDVERKLESGDEWKDHVERRGLGGTYVDICWETAISKAPCRPCAEISRVAYDVADTSELTLERRWDADRQKYYHVCFGTASVSEADQKAVLAQRDQRVPLGYQNGPEREMGPFLCIGILLWDIYAALCRAAGHENGGENNELIYLPLNSGALAFFFGIKFEHRAEPDTIDEIKFCQALGFEIYQLLKEDPNSRVDEIIDERFPGTDPTKWDFSSFKRSAAASQTSGASRKRKAPLTEASNKK